ncbi:MAG TPA: hypothetical protein VGM64_19205 [Lacunisphaera sp.]|jgi:hypothetical protein
MIKPLTSIAVFLVVCATVCSADLKREKWHLPTREYEAYDSVMVPVIDFALIQKIQVGATLEEVKKITGFTPVDYGIHPTYAILETKVDEEYYEVAFLHGESRKVEAISFRKGPWKKKAEANQIITAQRASRVAD